MTVTEAIKKAESVHLGLKVCNALELQNVYVFGFCGENGERVALPPCSVDKASGKIADFFPPLHLKELEKAKKIDLTAIKNS